jgi:hypothetical protein
MSLSNNDFQKIKNIVEEVVDKVIDLKVSKIIEDSNAEQMEMIFKHFVNMDEIKQIVKNEVDRVDKRLTIVDLRSLENKYKLDIDPVPMLIEDVKMIKAHLKLK